MDASALSPRTADADVAVRAVDPAERDTVELIATRMRATLAEVLGERRADEMFTHDQLRDRVDWHLDRADPARHAEVLVAEDGEGDVVGHTMLRIDTIEGEQVGLFATTYVTPATRRAGVASALLEAGERWFRAHRMSVAMTFTDPDNHKLLALFARRGYDTEQIDDEWARARRELR